MFKRGYNTLYFDHGLDSLKGIPLWLTLRHLMTWI